MMKSLQGEVDLYDVRDRLVANHLKDLGKEDSEAAKGSLYYRLIVDIATAAIKYVEKSERKTSTGDIEFLMSQGIEVVGLIQSALAKGLWILSEGTPSEEQFKSYYNFWKHTPNTFIRIKDKDIPYIDNDSLEDAVSVYLDLPYRSTAIDRLLVDALVASELYSYGDEMLNETKILFFPRMSPLKRSHPLIAFIKAQVWNGVLLLGLAALSIFAGEKEWISAEWGIGIAIVLAATFVLILVVALIFLPSFWKKQNAAKAKTIELLDSMNNLYLQLASKGLISSKHITHKAELAEEKGVIWPSSLFVLLDDISSRTGRF